MLMQTADAISFNDNNNNQHIIITTKYLILAYHTYP